MKADTIKRECILGMVLTQMAREGEFYAPVGVSVRHVHLSAKDLRVLFGTGYELHSLRDLVQPGQFAAMEQVTLKGPKGCLEKVRIIGPLRGETQVELSLTDAVSIGLKDLPVRMSGHLQDTPGIVIKGPEGEVTLSGGVIAAARHLHLNEEQAQAFHVHDGQAVSVKIGGERPGILEHVICRTGKGHELEFHVDTDEANACGLKTGDLVQILPEGLPELSERAGGLSQVFDPVRISEKVVFALTGRSRSLTDKASLIRETPRTGEGEELLELVTEQDINVAIRQGKDHVCCGRKALITPAAADRAAGMGIRIQREEQAPRAQAMPGREEEVLELVTASELNTAFRDNKKEIYCSQDAIITPAAKERIEETGIRIVRV